MTGLFGGSFDPVHLGHVATAEALRDTLGLREIRFLPAARSPLKAAATADVHRVAMLERALAGHPGLVLDCSELEHPAPSYTIDTLRRLRAALGPAEPLVFILGLDSFLELPRWKDWQALTDVAHLLVVNRPGSHPRFVAALAEWLDSRLAPDIATLRTSPAGRVLLVDTPPRDIASRTIRAAVRAGRDTAGWLNPAVRDYIDLHHLYCGEADPQ
ncbi:MAG: nicotinate-nucleotide adenylyltransferase [Pseudomonadota bacterium]